MESSNTALRSTPPARSRQPSGAQARAARYLFGPPTMLAAALLILVARLLDPDSLRGLIGSYAGMLSTVILATVLLIAVHEGGHMLAGLLVGYRLAGFGIGPVIGTRNDRRWQFQINWRWAAGGYTMIVPDDPHDTIRRDAIMIAAGPLAGLALAAVALLVTQAVLVAADARPWRTVVLELSGATCFLSGLISVASLVPHRNRFGQSSDGARLWMLWKGGAEAYRWIAMRCIHAEILAGRRPREWSATWITFLTAGTDDTPDNLSGQYNAYLWSLDSGQIERAGALVDRMVAASSAPQWLRQSGLLTELAYYEARYRHNPARARQYLAAIVDSDRLELRGPRLRAEAAILAAEGETAAARAKIQAAFDHVARHRLGDTQMGLVGIDWLNDLLAQLDRQEAGLAFQPLIEESE